MSQPIIHIGVNKTASTTMQRHIFAKHPQIVYLGEDDRSWGAFEYYAKEEHQKLLHSLVWDDDLHYASHRTQTLFCAASEQARSQDKVFVYSNEDISRTRLPTVVANRLKALLPDAKILIILRNQLTAVASWYNSHGCYVRDAPYPYFKKPVTFEDWWCYCTEIDPHYSPLAGFDYHKILSLYARVFGKENIKVLLFEDLLRSKLRFSEDLEAAVLGKYDCNLGGSCPFYAGFSKHERKSSTDFGLFPEWQEWVRDRYAESNSRVIEDFGLRLDDYDYPVAQRIRDAKEAWRQPDGAGQATSGEHTQTKGSSWPIPLGASDDLAWRTVSPIAAGPVCCCRNCPRYSATDHH